MSETAVLAELDLEEPPQHLLEWAKKHLNEDPDTRCKILDDFRNYIFSQGECTPHRTDDAFLLRFLRARYFIIKRAHRLIVNYCNFKEANPQFYENVHLKNLKRIGEYDIISVPPYRDQNGRRTLLYRLGQWDPNKFSVDELFQATIIILELAILEQRAQILGGVCIFDLSGLTFQQSLHLTPSLASKMVQIMVTSFPMKIESLHILNESWIFDIVYNIFKPFLEDHMKEKIFFHGDNFETLHKHIKPEHLPERYGGVHPDYKHNDWLDFFYSSPKMMKELQSLGYEDDSLQI